MYIALEGFERSHSIEYRRMCNLRLAGDIDLIEEAVTLADWEKLPHITVIMLIGQKTNRDSRNWTEVETYRHNTSTVQDMKLEKIKSFGYYNESIPNRREPYRRVPLGRVHLDERRLDDISVLKPVGIPIFLAVCRVSTLHKKS